MTFDDLLKTLDYPVFTIQGQAVTLGEFLIVPVFLLFGFMMIRWIVRRLAMRLTKNGVAPDLVHLIRRLLYVIAILAMVITILDMIDVPITAFAFLSGAVAIGVGFGAQNIINNFISGWILMWEQPIRIGDFLEVDNAKGTVQTINTRSTLIRRIDGVHMLIPNSKLLENTVVNWTLIDRLIRTSIRVGVAYGSPCQKVSELIMQATNEQVDVLNEPAPVVIFDDFGDSSLVFEVFFWVNATVEKDLRVIRSNIRFAIVDSFDQHEIVIAFPQQDIHMDGRLTLLSADSSTGTARD
jgi:small-conductance mechanosensitive channel